MAATEIQLVVEQLRAERAQRRNRNIPYAIKKAILARPCAICGRPDDIEVDHVISVRQGGSNSADNLQPLCRTCNSVKGAKRTNADVSEWIKRHPDKFKRSQAFRTKRLAYIASGDWW